MANFKVEKGAAKVQEVFIEGHPFWEISSAEKIITTNTEGLLKIWHVVNEAVKFLEGEPVKPPLDEARALIVQMREALKRAYDERLKEYGEPETHDPIGVTWCTPAKKALTAATEWLRVNK